MNKKVGGIVILKFTKPYSGYIIFALILMLLELAVELSLPVILSQIINEGILKHDLNQAFYYLGLLVVMSIAAFICGIINSFVASHVCHGFSFDLREALFQHIQKFSLTTLEKFSTSSIITRLTSDVIACEMVLFMSLRIMLRAPLLVIGSIVMSFMVAPHLAVYLLIGSPIIFIFLYISARSGMKLFKRVQKELDGVNRTIQQNLSSVRMIRANLSGAYETSKFESTSTLLKNDTVKALKLMERILPFLLIVMNIALLVVIYMGAKDVTQNALNVGALVAVINYALRMQGGFSMFAFIIIAFSRAKASSDRMTEVLKTPVDEELSETNIQPHAGGVSVEFIDVDFKYPLSHRNVLENINFKVNAGEKFVVMGATGSGKSAMLSLIPRMYEPTRGQILIDGKDIKEYQESHLREMIGYVPQKNTLFTGTVFDNIIFGNQLAGESEVMRATEIAQIHDNIMDFDQQYKTRVGQEGVNLSGGQKQRIAIARAIIREPNILILDDSTSALDIHTESKLFNTLQQLPMTRIIVSQKIETAKTADHILLLDQGKVVGFGDHASLLKTSELYQQINDSQERGEVDA
ncbi:ABC transporter ATP-binding protein [Macrococcoides caseolyticum]|uniref:ABC transporter ATP-binding protein n=1 Tax=Macrococcoides caseolyticum TaxID=69966 RepID=UPI001F217E3E|nr:ABC transporter ATP-binding protein [Macrococcus caseolyticus]MCE4957213.1 ABC transporter ATP-binding protein [Macrococcus caseolyticus]